MSGTIAQPWHLLVQRSTDLRAIVDGGDTAKALSQPEHSKFVFMGNVHFNGLGGEKILAFVSFCAGVFLPLLMRPLYTTAFFFRLNSSTEYSMSFIPRGNVCPARARCMPDALPLCQVSYL